MIEALLQSLSGPSIRARFQAAVAIGILWDGQVDMIDTLRTYVTSSDLSVKIPTFCAFIYMENKQSNVISILQPHLTDPSWLVRELAASALVLRDLDGHQPSVVTALLLALSDPSSRVRAEAARALRVPEGENSYVDDIPQIVDALLRATSDPDWFVRKCAAGGLSTSAHQLEVIGERLEQLLQQYEYIAYRDPGGYHFFFDALQEIAKKM